jgi:hypothetical protein
MKMRCLRNFRSLRSSPDKDKIPHPLELNAKLNAAEAPPRTEDHTRWTGPVEASRRLIGQRSSLVLRH